MSLRAAFTDQARHCAGRGSPFMARLTVLASHRSAPIAPWVNASLPGKAQA